MKELTNRLNPYTLTILLMGALALGIVTTAWLFAEDKVKELTMPTMYQMTVVADITLVPNHITGQVECRTTEGRVRYPTFYATATAGMDGSARASLDGMPLETLRPPLTLDMKVNKCIGMGNWYPNKFAFD